MFHIVDSRAPICGDCQWPDKCKTVVAVSASGSTCRRPATVRGGDLNDDSPAHAGVQLAPPVVGAVAYLSITQGPPDIVAHALLGYGVLQALVLVRLLPWIRQEPFAPSYWAFTFGATALAAAPLRMVARGDTGLIAGLATVLFLAANLLVVLIAIGTVRLALRRKLVAKAVVIPLGRVKPTGAA